jgi:hypothetical protein
VLPKTKIKRSLIYVGKWQILIQENVSLGFCVSVIFSRLKIKVAYCDILNAYFRRKYHSISSEKIQLVFGEKVYKCQ